MAIVAVKCIAVGLFVAPVILVLSNRMYTFIPADDLPVLVLMVNMLLWPKPWTRWTPRDELDENSHLTKRLQRLWRQMEANCIWKPYVEAAQTRGYDMLQEMGSELCLFLGSGKE